MVVFGDNDTHTLYVGNAGVNEILQHACMHPASYCASYKHNAASVL